jgi:beta-N-acetylhexosaminidase
VTADGLARLARLADAVLLPGFVGHRPPDWVRARVAGGLGGVVLFARNVASTDQVAGLTAVLRAERPNVVVAIDEEGGDVTRLDTATGSAVPGNLALGVADDADLTRRVAAALGRRLAAMGVTLDFAPVADVNSNPDNPVIGVRSFGADAALVARHTAAYLAGMQSAGVAACAKHFPGHGDTSVDSHVGVPTVGGDVAAALSPFRAAIEAGVAAIMTGHLMVPGHGDLPATINPAVIAGLLRGELGFDGLVVTDGLEMAAIAGTVGLAEGAIRALAAGVDAICVGGGLADEADATMLRDAIVDAVRSGRLSEDRLAEAGSRLARAGPMRSAAGGVDVAGNLERIGLEAARRALRCGGTVALDRDAPPVVVELDPVPNIAVGRTAWGLGVVLAARVPGTTLHRVGPGEALPEPPVERPLVVVTRDAARVDWVRDALATLVAARPDAVQVEMGLPGAGGPTARGYLATHGASRASAVAAVGVLTGDAAAPPPGS